jgi:hypothetical protein
MEQPHEDDPRSSWERMRSRPRLRWLADKAGGLADMAKGVIEEPDAPSSQPSVSYEEQSRRFHIRQELRERSASRVEPGDELDPYEYARYRREQQDWLTMEIGPGALPNGIKRRNFSGRSAYIGIDNHSYGAYSDQAESVFAAFRESRPEENILLRSDPNFGRAEDGSLDYYDFPDGTADEIYISQVYDKPTEESCQHLGDEGAMTVEAARLLKPGGKVLIFDYYRNLPDIRGWLDEAGLKLRFAFRSFTMDLATGENIHLADERYRLQEALDCQEGNIILIAEKPADWTRASAGKIRAPSYLEPSL